MLNAVPKDANIQAEDCSQPDGVKEWTMKGRSHDDADLFRDDPQMAAAALDAILADGDQGELLVTLRQMTKAFGGLPAVAKSAELNATQLYRTLSETGNPELRNLSALLRCMGMRLSVQMLDKVPTGGRRADGAGP